MYLVQYKFVSVKKYSEMVTQKSNTVITHTKNSQYYFNINIM